MQKKILYTGISWLWVAILVIAGDQYTKQWALQHLAYHEPLYIFPFLNLTLFHNTGAAFSFLQQASGWQNGLFGALAMIVSAILLGWLAKLSVRDRWLSIALCCVLGGALGNAWDRVRYGSVIDFLSFHWGEWYFAIFNIADSAICIGTFMLLYHWFIRKS